MTVITGLAYPLAMTGIAGLVFPHQADGSLVERDGHVIGSTLIGQNFAGATYFHGRPSATTDTDPADSSKTVPAPYNAQNSAGSNAGPTSKALLDRVTADAASWRRRTPPRRCRSTWSPPPPAGSTRTSRPAAALFQVPRVASARNLPETACASWSPSTREGRLFGLIGEAHVNVLALNLALDALGRS